MSKGSARPLGGRAGAARDGELHASGAERVIVVDGENRPVGIAPRSRVRAERLTHRATFVVVLDPAGQVLVQRRTMNKDLYPGYLDAAAGGVLVEGEDYDESAARELAEELGVEGVELERCFEFLFEDSTNSCWGAVFLCRHAGPFVLQAEEVESVAFHPVEAILDGVLEQVTPDTLVALRGLRERGLV